jgi:hypothetical protein
MTKTTTIIAMIGALTLGTALNARAQTPPNEPVMFVNVSVGGQFQSRDFSSFSTFELFNETGTVDANQTIGGGFVFDATAGHRFGRRFAGAIGVSTFNGSGEAAAVAAIPSPLFVGKPTIKNFSPSDYGDLKQSNVAINFQLVYIWPLTNRIDLQVFGGPSIVHVSQDIATATPVENSTATIESQSATSGKSGSVGIDLAYNLNTRYGVGGFVRYLGGQVDLPSVENFTIGGTQAGAGIRIRF